MRLVFGIDQVVADFVAQVFPVALQRGGFNAYAAIGMADDQDRLCGGIVVTEFKGHDANLSIYGARPDFLRPEMIRGLCRWAFVEQGLKRVTAEMAKKNRHARRFVDHAGFVLEGTKRHGWHGGNDDMCIYGMTADRCRWLEADK